MLIDAGGQKNKGYFRLTEVCLLTSRECVISCKSSVGQNIGKKPTNRKISVKKQKKKKKKTLMQQIHTTHENNQLTANSY